jgi:hypothetical protein
VKFDNAKAVKNGAGYWTLSNSVSVSGRNGGSSFSDAHISAKLHPDCSACHNYSANHTTTSIVWKFVHDPSNTGAPDHSRSRSQQGCNECH